MPTSSSPTLPDAVLHPATGFLALLLAFGLWRVKEPAARFVMIAMWLRYVLSAYHTITYQPVAAGLSVNALASVAVFAAGLAVARPSGWSLKALLPVYGLLLVVLVSGALNGEWAGALNAGVKWGYFLVVLLCAYQAAQRMGHAAFAGALLIALAPPIVLQWASVALGVSKAADDGGARSFIGGYDHEAAFSVALVTALWVLAFATTLAAPVRHALTAAVVAGLYLAVYRTTMLAAAPLAAAYVIAHGAAAFRRSDQAAVSVAMALVATAGMGLLLYVMQERLSDFGALMAGGDLVRPPQHFTAEERDLFSARLFLWSQYVDAWLDGGAQERVFGFGPETWHGRFPTYAHNTLVSALYETGLVGVAAVLWLWTAMAWQALRAQEGLVRLLLLAGHAAFLFINMATMGFWLVEGLILYALICAFTLAHAHAPAPARALTMSARVRAT